MQNHILRKHTWLSCVYCSSRFTTQQIHCGATHWCFPHIQVPPIYFNGRPLGKVRYMELMSLTISDVSCADSLQIGIESWNMAPQRAMVLLLLILPPLSLWNRKPYVWLQSSYLCTFTSPGCTRCARNLFVLSTPKSNLNSLIPSFLACGTVFLNASSWPLRTGF